MLKKYLPGIGVTIVLAVIATYICGFIPMGIVSGSVLALLFGMLLNPIMRKYGFLKEGVGLVSKQVLRGAIILMGITLSFKQVLEVGSYSLVVMIFTLATAFGGGYLIGRLLGMDWKLSSLIATGTGICGGSAIAAVSPTIEADDKDVAYAISAIFIFDIFMVILFPIAGHFFGMSDMGYGLWTGTAVNDTSAVVAAGYAFSDEAGAYSVIVKLTRTLAIIPTVLIFSWINQKTKSTTIESSEDAKEKVRIRDIFPYFILGFLVMVGIKSTGIVPDTTSSMIGDVSKFLMVMALGAIGLKTNFKEVAKSGVKPMLLGLIVSLLVVTVSFLVQMCLGQL